MTIRQKSIYLILVFIGGVFTATFASWWLNGDYIPNNFSGFLHFIDYILFILISFVVFHDILMQVLSWIVSYGIKKYSIPEPEKGLKVAFITTFVPSSEPYELLHNILPAMVKTDYKHDTWLLDEGDDDNAKNICNMYGVHYFTRKNIEKYNQKEGKFAAKTKGGNHNAWYDAHGHEYDIVAQIDTDFTPRKDFLTKTLGFFNDPQIAFVGTPQIYGNIEESIVAKGAAEQSYSFYGPILRGLAGRKMTLMIGANHVVRVKALKEIEFYNAHLTEDLITGMTLHSRKWRSVYVPEALAIGEGPSTWSAYFNQQMRWAFGCIDILFKHSFKLFRTMRKEQSVLYLLLQQHYFSGLAMAIGIFLLTLYSIFGIVPTAMDIMPGLLLYALVLIWQTVIRAYLEKFFIRPEIEKGPHWAGRIVSIAAWPIYFLAFIGVIRGKRLVFKVTPKGANQKNKLSLRLFLPHILILAVLGFDFIRTLTSPNNSLIMQFWIVITAVLMYTLIFIVLIHEVRKNKKINIQNLSILGNSKL